MEPEDLSQKQLPERVRNYKLTTVHEYKDFLITDPNYIPGVLIWEPPICCVSSRVKRFPDLCPGASWEGEKLQSQTPLQLAPGAGEKVGPTLGDDTTQTSGPCFRENREVGSTEQAGPYKVPRAGERLHKLPDVPILDHRVLNITRYRTGT